MTQQAQPTREHISYLRSYTGRRLGETGLQSVELGIWASGLCLVHCLLTPIVLSLSAVSVHYLPSEERTHRSLAILIAALGALALVRDLESTGAKSS